MTEPKWWDFTAKDEGITAQEVIDLCKDLGCDRFAFGAEVGDGGYRHYQGRIVLSVGKDLKTLSNWNKEHNVTWHWSPSHVRDFKYVEKEGNFYRSWEDAIAKYGLITLKSWQEIAWNLLKDQDERTVLVIYDPVGNHGKTWFCKWLQATHRAQYVPPFSEAQDFMAYAMSRVAERYVIDMPRAETIKQRKGMWSAVEQIKNGYVYDKRYNFRDAWIGEPKVCVFCNELPDKGTLSADRWAVYALSDEWGAEPVLMPMENWE